MQRSARRACELPLLVVVVGFYQFGTGLGTRHKMEA